MKATTEGRDVIGDTSPVPDPFAAAIPEACRLSGLSRSEIYRQLASGDIRAVKSGSRTLIVVESLRSHLAKLPAAKFRTRKVG